jgi:hypothetical protein
MCVTLVVRRFTFIATTTSVVVVDAGSAIIIGRVIIPVVTDTVTAHGSYCQLNCLPNFARLAVIASVIVCNSVLDVVRGW